MPNQKMPTADPTSAWPLADDYTDYSWDGFAYIQNWVANTILKRRTNNPDAQIVTMTVPTMLPKAIVDTFGMII